MTRSSRRLVSALNDSVSITLISYRWYPYRRLIVAAGAKSGIDVNAWTADVCAAAHRIPATADVVAAPWRKTIFKGTERSAVSADPITSAAALAATYPG